MVGALGSVARIGSIAQRSLSFGVGILSAGISIGGLTANPSFGASAQIGTTVTATVNNSPEGVTYTFQWREGANVLATGASYAVPAGVDTNNLYVQATGSDASVLTSPAYVVRYAPPVAVGLTPINEPRQVGTVTVTLSNGFSGSDPGTYSEDAVWLTGTGATRTVDLDQFLSTAATITKTNSGGAASVQLSANIFNLAPIANPDTVQTPFGQAAVFDPRINDTDGNGDPLTIIAATISTGSVAISRTATSLTVTPDAGFEGVSTGTYQISDVHGLVSNSTWQVTVLPAPNVGPSASNFTVPTAYQTAVPLNFGANTSDPEGDVLTITINTVSSGTVTGTGLTRTFTPAAAFSGAVTIGWSVSDGEFSASATATVNVAAEVVGPAPIISNPVATATGATTMTFTFDTNTTGPGNTVTWTAVPTGGGTTLTGTQDIPNPV